MNGITLDNIAEYTKTARKNSLNVVGKIRDFIAGKKDEIDEILDEEGNMGVVALLQEVCEIESFTSNYTKRFLAELADMPYSIDFLTKKLANSKGTMYFRPYAIKITKKA